jgi:hypothetical protein
MPNAAMKGAYRADVTVQATVPLVPTWVTKNGNVRRVSTLKDKTLRGIVRRAERAGVSFSQFRIFQAVKDELARRQAGLAAPRRS